MGRSATDLPGPPSGSVPRGTEGVCGPGRLEIRAHAAASSSSPAASSFPVAVVRGKTTKERDDNGETEASGPGKQAGVHDRAASEVIQAWCTTDSWLASKASLVALETEVSDGLHWKEEAKARLSEIQSVGDSIHHEEEAAMRAPPTPPAIGDRPCGR